MWSTLDTNVETHHVESIERDRIPAPRRALSGDDLAGGAEHGVRLLQRYLAPVHRPFARPGDRKRLGRGRPSAGHGTLREVTPGSFPPSRAVRDGVPAPPPRRHVPVDL